MNRFKKPVFCLCLVLLCFLFVSCKKESAKPLTLEFEANATTGYSWEYTVSDDSLIEIKNEYRQYENPQGFVGVGGKQIYTITPLKSGDVMIRFEYKAPGTKETASYAEYLLNIDKDLNIKEISHTGNYFDNK